MNEEQQVRTPGQYVHANPNKVMHIISGFLGARAASNYYQQTGDWRVAASKGLGAYVRWVVWFMAWGIWFFGGWVFTNFNGTYIGMWLCFLIFPFTIGVTYVRNVDFGLHWRDPIFYRFYAPIARMVEAVPTVVLYALLILPIMAGAGS